MSSLLTPIKALDKDHLKSLIQVHIKEYGFQCSLNHIDVSQVTDMSLLFAIQGRCTVDISNWDVSNVTNMYAMFKGSDYTPDLSRWNVSKVTDMTSMFQNSTFNGDLSNWDVSNVTTMNRMFANSKFNGDISAWNVSKVTNMRGMFDDVSKLKNPNVFVWLHGLEDMTQLKPKWQAHLTNFKVVLDALGIEPLQVAKACHTLWLGSDSAPSIESFALDKLHILGV